MLVISMWKSVLFIELIFTCKWPTHAVKISQAHSQDLYKCSEGRPTVVWTGQRKHFTGCDVYCGALFGIVKHIFCPNGGGAFTHVCLLAMHLQSVLHANTKAVSNQNQSCKRVAWYSKWLSVCLHWTPWSLYVEVMDGFLDDDVVSLQQIIKLCIQLYTQRHWQHTTSVQRQQKLWISARTEGKWAYPSPILGGTTGKFVKI